jgi:hypothetical protein
LRHIRKAFHPREPAGGRCGTRNDGSLGGPDSLVLGHRLKAATVGAPNVPCSRQPADETVLHELSASLVEIDGELGAIDGDDAPRAEFYVKYSHAGFEGG